MQVAARLVIFSDPTDEREVHALSAFVDDIHNLGAQLPPTIWVTHTATPECEDTPERVENIYRLSEKLMQRGLDGVVASEHSGFKLAFAISSRFRSIAQVAQMASSFIAARRHMCSQQDALEKIIHHMLWEYLRPRSASSLPSLDNGVEAEDGTPCIQGYACGGILGKGAFARVYRITHLTTGVIDALKIVSKSSIVSESHLAQVGRMIEIMSLLSSKEWAHPNVTRFFQAYHGPTMLMYRVEYAGAGNLWHHLRQVQTPSSGPRALSLEQAVSIVQQILHAVAHLHVGPKVCHRDIKPENIVVNSTEHAILLKLTDFDVAMVFQPDPEKGEILCRSICGTFPFVAPEVILSDTYVGCLADMWSFGIVLLEVLCGTCVVEESSGIHARSGDAGRQSAVAMVAAMKDKGAVKILSQHVRPELLDLFPVATGIVEGVLNVEAAQRLRCPQILEIWRKLVP